MSDHDNFYQRAMPYRSDAEKQARRMTAQLVGAIIRRRKELKLSQQDVAERAGISQTQVARLENFATMPKLDTVLKVAAALQMELDLIAAHEQAAAAAVLS